MRSILGRAELAHIPVTSPALLQLTFPDPCAYQRAGSLDAPSLPRTPVYLVTCAAQSPKIFLGGIHPTENLPKIPSVQDYQGH